MILVLIIPNLSARIDPDIAVGSSVLCCNSAVRFGYFVGPSVGWWKGAVEVSEPFRLLQSLVTVLHGICSLVHISLILCF